MKVDLARTCRLVADHLEADGTNAQAAGRRILLDDGIVLELELEGRPDPVAPSTPFWINVAGLRLKPSMRLDVAAWATTAEACEAESAHGIVGSIVPPLLWLAREPWSLPGRRRSSPSGRRA